MKNRFFLLLLLIAVYACNPNKQVQESSLYFDLNQYFKQEASRLNDAHTTVNKTVVINGKKEQKQIAIKNWTKEFEIFTDADINKASWRGFFQSSKTADIETYTTNDPKIPVKKLIVRKADGKVTSILLYIQNNNGLYQSQDSLSYYPDSLYQIKKTQKIKLLAKKTYKIIGRF